MCVRIKKRMTVLRKIYRLFRSRMYCIFTVRIRLLKTKCEWHDRRKCQMTSSSKLWAAKWIEWKAYVFSFFSTNNSQLSCMLFAYTLRLANYNFPLNKTFGIFFCKFNANWFLDCVWLQLRHTLYVLVNCLWDFFLWVLRLIWF